MAYLRALALTLVVLLLAEICCTPLNKEVTSQGKEVERGIEALDEPMDLALTSSDVENSSKRAGSHMSRGKNDDLLAVKEAGKTDQSSKQIEATSGSSAYQHLVAVAQEIELGLRTQHDQINLEKRQMDWLGLMDNVAWTRHMTDEAIPSRVAEMDSKTRKENLWELNVFFELLETVYGRQTLGTSTSQTVSGEPLGLIPKPSLELEEYKQWIRKLVSFLDTTATMHDTNFYARAVWNSCIFNTLSYLYKYHLIPAESEESFQGSLRNPVFLKWLAMESHGRFVLDVRYWSKFPGNLEEVEFLQNHPLLSSVAEIFNGLGRREQDFVGFYRLKFVLESCYEWTLAYDGMDPNKFPIQAQWHLNFLKKMEKIVSKELQGQLTQSQYDEELASGFLEVKDDLMNLKNFLIRPVISPKYPEQWILQFLRFSFDILDYAQKKYGAKFTEQLGLNDRMDPSTLQYKRSFEFMKATRKLNVWMAIATGHTYFVLTQLKYHGRFVPYAWSEANFFWNKLLQSADAYEKTLVRGFSEDRAWKELISTNEVFDLTKAAWDHEIDLHMRIYQTFKKIASEKITGNDIDKLEMELCEKQKF
ncbi:hypothetical protein PTTG_26074 [Puccinia triticina 1-1 BBBD Race 1]|uniref:Uncharacterized protein n=1 Tax=Puccinia triticina (isolate 1-1 / race 1 (BBBD)) TaxID=630390 RepID=A0A180GXE5_PUCT1|nr:hypothetical protein PTTG_26074 [Puccinia triticina 1-1 BBBD Race 1]